MKPHNYVCKSSECNTWQRITSHSPFSHVALYRSLIIMTAYFQLSIRFLLQSNWSRLSPFLGARLSGAPFPPIICTSVPKYSHPTRHYSTTVPNEDSEPKEKKRRSSLTSLKNFLYSTKVDKKKLQNESKLEHLITMTSKDLSLYSTSQLVSLLKCLQKVRFHSPGLLESIAVSLSNRPSELSLEAAAGVVRTFRDQGLVDLADRISSLLMDRLLTVLEGEEDIHPRTVTSLLEGRDWPPNMDTRLEEYVLSKAEGFSLHSLSRTLTFMLRKRCITRPVLEKCADMAQKHLERDFHSVDYSDVGTVFWVYGKLSHYNPGLFQSLTKVFQKDDDKRLSSWFVTTVVWSCAKVRYYDPVIMNTTAQYSLRHLKKFSFHDLSNLVYSFGALSHPHDELFGAVASKMVEAKSTKGNEQAFWVLAWASMVLGVYDKKVLSRVLNPEFMEGVCVCVWCGVVCVCVCVWECVCVHVQFSL